MNAAEVLRKTKNVLFERGWYQGDFEGPHGEVCLEAAYSIACGNAAYSIACGNAKPAGWAQGQGFEAIRRALPDDYVAPFVFNDRPSTTFDDVMDLLDKAEKIAEAMS